MGNKKQKPNRQRKKQKEKRQMSGLAMCKGGRRPDRASEAGEGPSRPASPET
ncbi:hypothetical protein SGRA_2829 [Saprospira grandis str. Lewin]|uniref:Uncharacterized protein n=1 Tax=Saprospira grandis (strain Lewin) TaxID=984262 RepID=H6LA89_SAPGL|nr:hypothetical protein SGRA_2829 [Saprospira grandis str. Lewin]